MKIGMCGLGKLGLPVAVSISYKGYKVVGYDSDPAKIRYRSHYENRELGPDGGNDFQVYFNNACNSTCEYRTGGLEFVDCMRALVEESDIIFVAIQTPHDPKYDGSVPCPPDNKDFDYSYLRSACKEIAEFVEPNQTVAIISTMLPGTMRREILPILEGKCRIAYNPFFIAMGTVMRDFLNPEFVLIGEEEGSGQDLANFYMDLYKSNAKFDCNKQIRWMSFESAELTKVAYNTYITAKICFSNYLMEVCHKIPYCNVDDVIDSLKMATDRIVSTKYMSPGMGDGGNCHPRDNIAMSWLSEKLGISWDFPGRMVECREEQTKYLAKLAMDYSDTYKMPLVLLGKTFKPESDITTGSPALLLASYLERWDKSFQHIDPFVGGHDWWLDGGLYRFPAVYLLTTKHEVFKKFKPCKGSVVFDPFRFLGKIDGVTVIPIGKYQSRDD